MLGAKGLESFAWSAANDADDEFWLRYGERVPMMHALHDAEESAAAALARLDALTKLVSL